MSWLGMNQPAVIVNQLLVVLATRVVFTEHILIGIHGSRGVRNTTETPLGGYTMDMKCMQDRTGERRTRQTRLLEQGSPHKGGSSVPSGALRHHLTSLQRQCWTVCHVLSLVL